VWDASHDISSSWSNFRRDVTISPSGFRSFRTEGGLLTSPYLLGRPNLRARQDNPPTGCPRRMSITKYLSKVVTYTIINLIKRPSQNSELYILKAVIISHYGERNKLLA